LEAGYIAEFIPEVRVAGGCGDVPQRKAKLGQSEVVAELEQAGGTLSECSPPSLV